MIGKTISRYKILEKLGEGGMGVVYKAEDLTLKRIVALKFLPPELTRDDDIKKRFIQEAQAASALDHQNICTVFEVDETDDGQMFISMNWYDGEPLKRKIERGPLRLDEAVHIAIQTAEGLSRAHEKGIIHRDIKPANLMITSRGEAKIVDFGLAKLSGEAGLTKAGTTVGTVGYMSPEQTRAQDVDHRTDIWSLGVLLYEMITGLMPFKGDHEQAIVYSIVNEEPEPLTGLRSGVPMELERITAKCLNKQPSGRYQHVDDLLVDLRGLALKLSGPHESRAVNTIQRSQKRSVAVRAAGVIAIVVFLALALAVLYPRFFGPASEESEPGMKKLAVLFFENLGPSEDEYFADGTTDAITARLAGIHGLGVISRQSTIQYKGSDKSIAVIGDELGTEYILEGTIQRERPGDPTSRVRIIPQLIRVSDDIHLWAATYDEDMTEVFRVQSDIAERVANALDITLLGAEREVLKSEPTDNLEAYEYYLRGNEYYFNERYNYEESMLAVEMYEKAVELDPEFAGAWAGLSQSYVWLFYTGFSKVEDARVKAKAAVDRALQLDPDSPDAHLALGYYYYYGLLDYGRSLEHLNIARQKLPNSVEILTAIGLVKRRQNDWDESVDLFEKAIDLNPRHSNSYLDLGVNFAYLRRYDEAEECFDRVIALTPRSEPAYVDKITTCLARDGNTDRAEEVLKTASAFIPPVELIDEPPFACIRAMPETFSEMFEKTPREEWGAIGDTILFYLGMAEINDRLGRDEGALAYYDSARVMIESISLPLDGPRAFFRSYHGLAYTGLGLHEEGTRIARDALRALPISDDAVVGAQVAWISAVVFARAGEYDESIDQIERLLKIPSQLSRGMLRVDPVWDPLRDDPRFQRLLEGDE